MSRTILALSAAAFLCASSQIDLADESGAKFPGKLRRRGCFKERVNRTEPHGSVSWASMINTCWLGAGASCGWNIIQSFITKSGCQWSALVATSSSASGISRRKITHTSTSIWAMPAKLSAPIALRYSVSIRPWVHTKLIRQIVLTLARTESKSGRGGDLRARGGLGGRGDQIERKNIGQQQISSSTRAWMPSPAWAAEALGACKVGLAEKVARRMTSVAAGDCHKILSVDLRLGGRGRRGRAKDHGRNEQRQGPVSHAALPLMKSSVVLGRNAPPTLRPRGSSDRRR